MMSPAFLAHETEQESNLDITGAVAITGLHVSMRDLIISAVMFPSYRFKFFVGGMNWNSCCAWLTV